jgi:hypothetical protein
MENITSGQSIESGIVADIAGYVPASAVVERGQRQEARYWLRGLLRQVTSLQRVRTCGLPFSCIVVRRKDGVHHFSGMSTCGSGWACPVCSAKIRYHRALEVSKATVNALDRGMGALFVTRTLPHSYEDRLGVTLNLLNQGRWYVVNQTTVKAARAAAGYIGGIAAKEITYGHSGWHPHSHDIELYKQEISLEHFATLSNVYYDYLDRFYTKHGFAGLSRRHGVQVEHISIGGAVLANYVTKLQEGSAIRLHTAQELTRADLKQGRAGSLMPLDIAYQYFKTRDMTLLRLWHEYERATFWKSVIRFTEGLRELLLGEPDESDPEKARKEVGGVDAVQFNGWFYRKIARVPGLEGKVLTALDTGGFAALVELLTVYHLDDASGYYQIEDTSEQESEG